MSVPEFFILLFTGAAAAGQEYHLMDLLTVPYHETFQAGFVDTLSGNFHLSAGSACIDAGDPDPIYNDPDGTRNDLGAFGGPLSTAGRAVSVPVMVSDLVKVYPNPISSRLYLEFMTQPGQVSVELYSITGQKLFESNVYEKKTEISFLNFKPGIYILKINSRCDIPVYRIIRQ